ncbi:ATP-binding protein [Paraferrimonas sp. SM1919]|uniref:ATP-binding protein n=1 Tax=Paraferrimonas sp. SM1919 TaxID=2662263 RepID=UPI0013D1C192|nr:ATP-binding protein [Paraferrimonas sp. SM1919]
MSQLTFQLKRILIIDSFWKGKTNEIRFDEHTQLEGTNGAGKTTIMRLLPLFYGMRPSEIASKVDQGKNFADYYLPRDSSFLVYEYQRPSLGQLKTCIMIATSDGRRVNYKLIEDQYRSECFIAVDGQPFKLTEIERHYKKIGAYVSRKLGVDQYKQVIQNLNQNRTSELKYEQQRFSFSDRPMPHIDKVVAGTIEKNLDFDTVKNMLVAICEDRLARQSNQINKEQISLNKEEIAHWLSDIQASRQILNYREAINDCHSLFIQYADKLEHLGHLYALVQQREIDTRQTQQGLDAELADIKTQFKLQSAELSSTIDSIEDSKAQNKADLKGYSAELEALDRAKDHFDEQDAASFKIKAAQLNQFQQELIDVEQTINSYSGEIGKTEQHYHQLIEKLNLKRSQGERDKLAQIQLLQNEQNKQLSEIESHYNDQRNLLVQSHHAGQLEINKQQLELQQQLSDLQQQLQNPRLPVEHIERVEQSRNDLNNVQAELNYQLRLLSQEDKVLADLDKQRQQQLAQLSVLKQHYQELDKQYLALEKQLYPEAGSLHHFLTQQEHHKDWINDIGALVSQQTLERTDLNPQWVAGEQNLYGFKLDKQVLSLNNKLALSQEQLSEQLDALDNERNDKQAQIHQAELELTQTNSQYQRQQQTIATTAAKEQKIAQQVKQLQQELDALSVKAKQLLKEVVQDLQKQIALKNDHAKQFENKLSAILEQQSDELESLHNNSLEQRLQVESEFGSQIEELELQKQQLIEQCAQDKKDYQQQLKDAIKQLDSDGTIAKLAERRQALLDKIRQCSEFANQARMYQDFMEHQYINRNVLSNKVNELESIVKAQQTELDQAKHQLKACRDQFNLGKNKLNHQLEALEHRQTLLLRAIRELEKIEVEAKLATDRQQFSADTIASFVDSGISEFKSLSIKIKKYSNDFENTIRRFPRSQLYDTWLQLLDSQDQALGQSILKYQQPLIDILHAAEQLKSLTSQKVVANANSINELYRHLENFDRQIKAVGAKLSKQVTSLARFRALADINAHIVTRLDQQEYWAPLSSFAECYEIAKDSLFNANADIPEELIIAMEELARVLPSEGLMLNHRDLFEIEFIIAEQGQVKKARNARQLKKISSTGLSYLAMLSLFCGLLGMLREACKIPSHIILPVDELGELAAENIELLLNMFSDNNIQMLSASPATDRQILILYKTHYKLQNQKIYQAKVPVTKLEKLALAAKGAAAHV